MIEKYIKVKIVPPLSKQFECKQKMTVEGTHQVISAKLKKIVRIKKIVGNSRSYGIEEREVPIRQMNPSDFPETGVSYQFFDRLYIEVMYQGKIFNLRSEEINLSSKYWPGATYEMGPGGMGGQMQIRDRFGFWTGGIEHYGRNPKTVKELNILLENKTFEEKERVELERQVW